jgi:thiol-disulfide isomerase/thioredoxin
MMPTADRARLTARSKRTALGALVALALAAPLSAQVGIKVGAKAPGAVVEDVAGKPVDLAAYVGKQPVLIEFWATWCSNCKELEPAMHAAAKKYAGKVRFVGVAVGVNQSANRVKLYAEKHGLPLEVLYDRTGAAADAYDVPATSYIVVIDRSGKVVYTGLGGDQNIEAALAKAL